MAQTEADVVRGGQGYGSYGGALVGQMRSQGLLDSYRAGLERLQQDFNNLITGRQSYFAGGPRIAQEQNSADVQRGLGLSQLELGANRDLNQYNLATSQMLNSFNLGNYGNTLNRYKLINDAQANRAYGLGSLIGSGVGLLTGNLGGLKGLFSRGGGSAGGGIQTSVGGQPLLSGFSLPSYGFDNGMRLEFA